LFSLKPRDLKRMMKRMGIEVEEINATKVEVSLSDGSRLVVEAPQAVLVMRARGQPPMMYVIGEITKLEAKAEELGGGVEISDEDVQLVVEQTGASPEEARRALEETGGDIAAAILRLKEAKE
jgi:nascent polypeptide-associated complex subunit alpha